ncbi:MAG: hypothetical protein R2744_13660 [Bacteroidales bacterium]
MKVNLLDTVEYGGCSTKIAPKQLEEILSHLPLPVDPNILVDIDNHDDAVYRLNDTLCRFLFSPQIFSRHSSDSYRVWRDCSGKFA